MVYPYSSALLLNDDVFIDYGGDGTKGSSKQRNIAYWMAELTASERQLNTFLVPTTVTGTYLYNQLDPYLILDHTYVTAVHLIQFVDTEEDVYYTISGTANVYASIRSNTKGLVDIHQVVGNCQCHTSLRPYPYQVNVIYTAGFSSGTAWQPNILMGLTIYADIILNEMVGFGNEGAGDVGIERFSNQGYSESRRIRNTVFGSSPRAMMASRLFQPYTEKRYVGL